MNDIDKDKNGLILACEFNEFMDKKWYREKA